MFKLIDYFLDRITMYRLALYVLIVILVIACFFSFFGFLKISYVSIIFSSVFLVLVCLITNKIFAKVFEVPANVESTYITALILALIITPVTSVLGLPFLFWAGVLAMSSKYIIAINKRHIFNPAAISVVITGFFISQYASWWIGTLYMAPFVFLLGLLVIRKIRREDMVITFFVVTVLVSVIYSFFGGNTNILEVIQRIFFETPILFFGFIMLTEPLTSPSTRKNQILYGALTGLLITPQFSVINIHFTPEVALIFGNIFSYIINPNYRLLTSLIYKIQLSPDTFEFAFAKRKNFKFIPGQYMEWALPHAQTDSRGNRRYFSFSSSPTEKMISITVKFYENSSSYKTKLFNLKRNENIITDQVAGDFTLPKDLKKPLVFIAGGVGITPFRSMIKYILDKNLKADIILIYSNKTKDDILFSDIFKIANSNGIKTIYNLTDLKSIPSGWQGTTGHITKDLIQKNIPDFDKRIFYISGPQLMVQNFEQTLRESGVGRRMIKTDFFPGYLEK